MRLKLLAAGAGVTTTTRFMTVVALLRLLLVRSYQPLSGSLLGEGIRKGNRSIPVDPTGLPALQSVVLLF